MNYREKVYLTTSNGLTVYNIVTLTHEDHKLDLRVSLGTDLFNSGGSVFVYSIALRSVFLFSGTSFIKVSVPNPTKHWRSFFQANAGHIFSAPFANPFKHDQQVIDELLYEDGKFQVLKKIVWNGSIINSISSTTNNSYWINSMDGSVSDTHRVFLGYNTFNAVTDKEGNNWFLSANGLFVHHKSTLVKKVETVNERVFSLAKKGNYFYLGALGKILKYDIKQRQIVKTILMPEWKFEVGFIKYLDCNEFVVQSGSLNYFFNDSTLVFRRLGGATYSTDAVQFGDEVYFASELASYYNIKHPQTEDIDIVPKQLIEKACQNCLFTLFDVAVIPEINKIILAADGNLIEFKPGSFNFITYNGQPIIASALLNVKSKLYIATLKFGILLYENHLIRQLITPQNLGPEKISKICLIGGNLWLLNPGAVKLVDIRTGKIIKNDLTGDYNVTHVEAENNEAYFIASNSLYHTTLHNITTYGLLNCKNQFTVIDGIDTVYGNNITVSYKKNDFQFNLSFPVFGTPEKTRFKYRLKGVDDPKWRVTNSADGIVRFASLMPGRYIFEAYAFHPNLGKSQNTISFNLLILPPWWDTWLFKTIIVLSAFILTVIAIKIYYKAKLSRQRIFFENALAIEKERQRISREIHDDIGQSLSVIKLNLNIGAPAQLQEAKTIISDVIKNLRELTHTLYYGKLLADDLANSVRKDIARLNTANQVHATLQLTGNEAELTSEQELGAYRIYQEAISNILKHADAEHIHVSLHSAAKVFEMIIADDGKGFIDDDAHMPGLGLSNMKKRAGEMGAQLFIDSTSGKGTQIRLIIGQKAN
jgi:signal transduction histidine kinase